MKRVFWLFILLLQGMLACRAAYISNHPVTLVQPDGSIVHCFVTGDEFYSRLHDANDYTIVRNFAGVYCYAVTNGDELLATQWQAGRDAPEHAGISPGANLPGEKIRQIRLQKAAMIPKARMAGQNAKSAGTLNNLVVFIRFAGESEFTDPISVFDQMFNGSAGSSSMKNYFEEASFNTLHIPSSFFPQPGTTVVSYQDIYPRSHYMPFDAVSNPGGYTDQAATEHELLSSAIAAVSSQIPSGLNLDFNNDGYVDNICFIISGNTTAWSTLLWPHRWSLFSQTVTINGKQVSDYNVQIRDHLIGSGVGVLCHEMFHTLGAPDLYHYSQDGLSPAGIWDVMESNQNPPQSMGAYMKYRYGNWISSVPVISAPGVYTLNPVTHPANNCYRINSPNSLSEYFLVEYRKDSGIFESSLPGSGLIVYRINSDFDGQGNAGYDGVNILDEVYIYRPYGSISQNGTVSDANYSASVFRRKINDNTNPSSFLSDGQPGGLRISNVTASAGTITFELNGGPVLPVNAALESIVSPLTGCNGPVQTVKAEIRNYGSSALAPGFNVSYRIQSQAVVTETYTGPAIASGGQALFTFGQPATLPPGETAVVKIWVSVAGDSYPANDTASCIFVNAWLNYPAELAQNLIQTYTSLGSNGNAISTSGFDDANSAPVNIGFNFYYNCRWFNQFILNTNGFIKLGSVPPSTPSLFFTGAQSGNGGIFNSNDTTDNNIIAAFNHDLAAGTITPEYRVFTTGTVGSRICTIQYKNVRDKSNPPDPQYDNIEFQIKLYEQDYRIEFVYGIWQASSASSAFKTSAVGLKGSHNSYGHLLVCRKGSAQSWDNIIFENSNYSGTSTLNFGRPPDRPAPGSGRTLRFVPGQQPNVVSLPASAVNSASAIANGTVSAGDYAGQVFFEYGLTASYGNTIIASPAQLPQGATSAVTASITGLNPATQYHFRAVFINPQGTFYGSGLTFTTLTTGISSDENINPVIFPNPASDKINIQLHGGNVAPGIMITDLNGKLLLDKKPGVSPDFLYTLNTEILPPGVYILRIIAGESVSCYKICISGE